MERERERERERVVVELSMTLAWRQEQLGRNVFLEG